MAANTAYHKLESEGEGAPDGEHGRPPWYAFDRLKHDTEWRGWLRLLGEAVLVLAVIVLGVRAMLDHNGISRQGPNDPKKDCKGFIQCFQANMADVNSRLRRYSLHERQQVRQRGSFCGS